VTDDVYFECEIIRENRVVPIQELKGRVEVDVPTRGTTRNKWQIVLLLSSQSVGGSFVQECLASCDHLTNL
jgi:hypothetical protein